MNEDKLPIPQKLTQFSEDLNVTNYFKQLHDKIVELNDRVNNLENP